MLTLNSYKTKLIKWEGVRSNIRANVLCKLFFYADNLNN